MANEDIAVHEQLLHHSNSGVVSGGSPKSRRSRTASGSQPEGKGSKQLRLGQKPRRTSSTDRRTSATNPSNPSNNRWKKGRGCRDESLFDWKAYDRAFWQQYWLRFSGVSNPNNTRMPLSGGTRMLRARRKDINVKPNRRLDRKSSKGMLFENEELRMRTIAINSEVEQGQHALKKLRRENELLRREVWSLRDEYTKMENMLQKKDTDGEESDQENSYSEGDSDGSEGCEEEEEDEAERNEDPTDPQEEPSSENPNEKPWLTPRRSSRAFDGLSVIDELTEETATTDGHGNSRASSVAHPERLPEGIKRLEGQNPMYTFLEANMYKNRKGFDDNLEVAEWGVFRPSSPYPYAKATPIPTYDHRLQSIQQPNIPATGQEAWNHPGPSGLPYQREDMTRWVDPVPGPGACQYPRQVSQLTEESECSLPPPPPDPGDSLGIVDERLGPDIFITDSCYFPPPPDDLIALTSDLNKIEISQADEITREPQRAAAASGAAGEAAAAASLVGCQFASIEESRESGDLRAGEHMRATNAKSKPFQSKLTLTLRIPEKTARHSPCRQTVSATQPSNGKLGKSHSGGKHDLLNQQTCSVNSKTTPTGSAPGRPVSRPAGKPATLPAASDIPIPETKLPVPRILAGSSTSLDGVKATTSAGDFSLRQGRTPPAPPPRTSSCPTVATAAGSVPTPPVGVTALHHRAFRKGKSGSISSHQESDKEAISLELSPVPNPLLLSDPVATSSPTLPSKFSTQKSTDSQQRPKLRKQSSVRSTDETTDEGIVSGSSGLLRKSSKTSKTEADRQSSRKSRKQSQVSLTSLEQALNPHFNPNLSPLDRARLIGLNNISISSSSGLDSPTKSERRKRRVSIKFNKKTSADDERPGILSHFRSKSRCDETDQSDRERTNSVSSRTSSLTRRKLSSSSSRTVFREEKIPWCGCWGNGCV